MDGFAACVRRWAEEHGDRYPRYNPEQFRQIAANIVAYQNADGGWPADIDMLAMLDPDSIRTCLDERRLRSSLENTNITPQIGYLSDVFYLTGDSLYCKAAARGMEYLLAAQQPDGNWPGGDASVVHFGDGIVTGVLGMWLDVLQGRPAYAWVAGPLKGRIVQSQGNGVALLLHCQLWADAASHGANAAEMLVPGGVRTGWAAAYAAATLTPQGGVPVPDAATTERVVYLLMAVKQPAPEIVDAVNAAVGWFEATAVQQRAGQTRAEFRYSPAGRVLERYPEWLRKVVGRIGKPDF